MSRTLLIYIVSHLFAAALFLPATGRAANTTLTRQSVEQLMDSGRHYFEQRQADEALRCFLAVSERSTDSVRLRIRALNNVGCVYKYFYRDYAKAHDYLTRAYHLCDSLHDDQFMPVIMVNMGDLINDYSLTANSEALSRQAHDIFDQCMQRAADSRNWELMVTAFFNLSNQNYSLPLDRYRTLFSTEIPDSTPDIHYARLQFQGLQNVQQRRYAEARNCFEQQLAAVSTPWEPVRDSIATYASIAYTYRMEGDYDHEIAYLERALQVATLSDVGDQTAYLGHLLTEARASQLGQRHRQQQVVLLAIGLMLLAVLGSAFLLWRKNRQLFSRNKSLYEKNRQLLEAEQQVQQLSKYSHSRLSDNQRQTLIYRIQELLADADTVCQQDFTVAKLSKLVDSNTTYVSQVINERYGTSFSNVLAAARIKEACRRMSDESDRYSHVTIEAIAASVGFKSRTAFLNAFKREVGLTPSEYLRMAQTANH